jgi:hypothetical protein
MRDGSIILHNEAWIQWRVNTSWIFRTPPGCHGCTTMLLFRGIFQLLLVTDSFEKHRLKTKTAI